jgi:magnesium-transporting ATPase (P-type)
MARCHPEDKLELVKFLKNELGYQVAVTGMFTHFIFV